MSSELATLATEIDHEIDLGDKHGLQALHHYRTAGERLLKAKADVPHGSWSDWLAANVKRASERSAQRYMRLAKRWPELEAKAPSVADMSLAAAEALVAAPRSSSPYLDRLAETGELYDIDLLDLGGMFCALFTVDDRDVSGFVLRDPTTATERYLVCRLVASDVERGEVAGTGRGVSVTGVPLVLERLGLPPLSDDVWEYHSDGTWAEEVHATLMRRGRRPPPRWRDATPKSALEAGDTPIRDELAAAETVLGAFSESAEALREIRDQKLYRGTHATFQDYVRDRWNMPEEHLDLVEVWLEATRSAEAAS